jgi:hypothetical protein
VTNFFETIADKVERQARADGQRVESWQAFAASRHEAWKCRVLLFVTLVILSVSLAIGWNMVVFLAWIPLVAGIWYGIISTGLGTYARRLQDREEGK